MREDMLRQSCDQSYTVYTPAAGVPSSHLSLSPDEAYAALGTLCGDDEPCIGQPAGHLNQCITDGGLPSPLLQAVVEPATGNREQETGNREQGAGNILVGVVAACAWCAQVDMGLVSTQTQRRDFQVTITRHACTIAC